MMKRTKISDKQREALKMLDACRPLIDGKHGWMRARLFDPRTLRSLISRGFIEPSSRIPWMLKYNLDDMTVIITAQGVQALADTPN